MVISAQIVKEVRDRVGAGMLDCKSALLETDGDVEGAIAVLKDKGLAIADKKRGNAASEGVIESYVHHTARIGVLVEVNCETDFVARTQEFRTLAHDIAMQIAAAAPQYVASEEMPPEEQSAPQSVCLLEQPFVKDASKSVQQIISEMISMVGENIRVKRFARFEIGC
ncbi:MAG: translation elongation factor Ts [Dehalococcoidia bacterium]|nr:translation elongation factor Ts [Dehalococcoidia bacterium]